MTEAPRKVLFACVHNAGRSQMAAAFFNAIADPARFAGESAGLEPAPQVHPEIVAVMREVGFDLVAATPRVLTNEIQRGTFFLVTLGCGERCPLVPGARRVGWPLEDPKGKPLERVREIRDEVRRRVELLVAEHGWGRDGS
jgi:arsenate reductase